LRADSHASAVLPTSRRAGLALAWKSLGHYRVLLSLAVVLLVLGELCGASVRGNVPTPGWVLAFRLVWGIGFFLAIEIVCVRALLALLVAVTGRSGPELQTCYGRLPFLVRIPLGFASLLLLTLFVLALVAGSLYLAFRLAGLA
jgi:hypothetical protein